ncbi:MAG TPA: hypothetical protein VFB45_17575 [Pseudolabrys sp.]|nr:hypothetical protein [Pseudolabrys sp.]
MSGSRQHHIPQMMQRGFLIDPLGKAEQVYVFTREKSYPSSIGNVAVERHFYSELAPGNTPTLDTVITDYEAVLGGLLKSLRALPVGAKADGNPAAEAVAHLTIRNDHLRRSMTDMLRSVANHAVDVFCDEKNLRKLMGIDEKNVSPTLKAQIDEYLAQNAGYLQLGLPVEVLHKVAAMMLKEHFSRFFVGHVPLMRQLLQGFEINAKAVAREGHNKALTQGLTPDRRTALLRELEWAIHASPSGGAILPDCVALGIEPGNLPQPLILADLQKLAYAIMPLTTDRVLVGQRSELNAPDLSQFNSDAAQCSHSLFISHRGGEDLTGLADRIGERSRALINEMLGVTFENFRKERGLGEESGATAPQVIDEPERPDKPVTPPPNYSVKFIDISDKQVTDGLADILKTIVVEMHKFMPLDRLDGFTFADDYEAALLGLDRGFDGAAPLVPSQSDYGTSVARTPPVIRNRIIKSHIIARLWIATNLVSEDETRRQSSLHMIVSQLAHVTCNQMLDEALPGFVLTKRRVSYETNIAQWSDAAWSNYFGTRASASFDPSSGAESRTLLISAIKSAKEKIVSARLAYRFDGNLDALLRVAFPEIGGLLGFAGGYLGHMDCFEQSEFDEELEGLFNELSIRAWVDLFREDLGRIWDNRGRWSSPEDFLLLGRHVERLLWQFGIFLWKNAEGRMLVGVPLFTDAQRLKGIRPALRLLWCRLVGSAKRLLQRLF